MMENRYQWLSPRRSMLPSQGQYPCGHFTNPTLPYNCSVSRTLVPGMSHHLPLTDNCENSFWNAGKARAALTMLHNQMGCQVA